MKPIDLQRFRSMLAKGISVMNLRFPFRGIPSILMSVITDMLNGFVRAAGSFLADMFKVSSSRNRPVPIPVRVRR
jgi:glycerate-2-kinase